MKTIIYTLSIIGAMLFSSGQLSAQPNCSPCNNTQNYLTFTNNTNCDFIVEVGWCCFDNSQPVINGQCCNSGYGSIVQFVKANSIISIPSQMCPGKTGAVISGVDVKDGLGNSLLMTNGFSGVPFDCAPPTCESVATTGGCHFNKTICIENGWNITFN